MRGKERDVAQDRPMPPRPEERPARRSASSSQLDPIVSAVRPTPLAPLPRRSPEPRAPARDASPGPGGESDRHRSARRPSGVGRVRSGEGRAKPAAEPVDPLEASWVLQGSGNFSQWQSGDETDASPVLRDDGSGLGEVRPARDRGGDERVVPSLTPELLAWLEERVTRRVTVAVHEAIHEALTRERGSLRVQREALAQAVDALERKRQAVEARREALRQAEARLALQAAACRCQVNLARRASSA